LKALFQGVAPQPDDLFHKICIRLNQVFIRHMNTSYYLILTIAALIKLLHPVGWRNYPIYNRQSKIINH